MEAGPREIEVEDAAKPEQTKDLRTKVDVRSDALLWLRVGEGTGVGLADDKWVCIVRQSSILPAQLTAYSISTCQCPKY